MLFRSLWSSETEYNRFMLRDRYDASDTRPEGQRAHWLGTLQWPHEAGWGWFTPAATVNTAAYDLDSPMADGRRRTSRTVPTLSADAGLRLYANFGRIVSGALPMAVPLAGATA